MSEPRKHLLEKYSNIQCESWVLGDAGYALEPFLMTPLRNTDPGTIESRYNKKHSSARNIVERTIGNLKSRFRCLLAARQLHYKPLKASKIVNVCCALHNICKYFKVEIEPQNIIEEVSEPNDENGEQNQLNNNADNMRYAIANNLQ